MQFDPFREIGLFQVMARQTFFSLCSFFLLTFNAAASDLKIMGATSCSASACHGGSTADDNQFTLWSIQDKHSQAYGVLFSEKSRLMVQILGQKTAAENEFCIECHATQNQLDGHGLKFDLHDGVGCESCHGPAEKWLEPHTRKGQTHSQNLGLGLVDLKNMGTRATTCIRCHSGLSHEVYSAGHPELTFELDTFSALMPRHWKTEARWDGARAWLIGQVVLLESGMKSFAANSEKRQMVDESGLNCVSCHHNLFDTDYELTPRGNGFAPMNMAHWLVLQPALQGPFPDECQKLNGIFTELGQLIKNPKRDVIDVIEKVNQAAAILEKIKPQIEKLEINAPQVQKWMKGIAAQTAFYKTEPFRSAEQAVLALDSLQHALETNAHQKDAAVKTSIQKLYDALSLPDPARYHRAAFVSQMELLAQKLGTQAPFPTNPEDSETTFSSSSEAKPMPAESPTGWWKKIKSWF